jgi:hypothetical protein
VSAARADIQTAANTAAAVSANPAGAAVSSEAPARPAANTDRIKD